MKTKKEYIYFREPMWQSILADIYMFASLVVAMIINHYLLWDSKFWAGFLVVLIIITASGRISAKKKTFHSKKELIKYLSKK